MDPKTPNPILTMFKTEWKYLGKENKKTYIFYMTFFVIAGALGLILPWLIGTIFNTIQSGEISTISQLKKLFLMFALIFVIKLVFWLIHGTARITEVLTGFKIHKNYANDKIRKVLELPVKWHKDNHTGDTIDRINKARLSIYSYAQHDSFQMIYILVEIFGSLAMIFFINPKAGAFALIFCSLILYLTMELDKKIKAIHKKVNQYDHKFSASIFDYFSNIITVITLRLKKTIKDRLNERVIASQADHKKMTYLVEVKWGFASLLISLMTVLILIYQSYTNFHSTGVILIGTLYMLYSYLDRVGNAFFKFAQFYGAMTKKAADIESTEGIEEAFKRIENKIKTKLPKNWQKVKIKNLNFTYNDEGSIQHIDGVNFEFRRGQRIALIGESGSGKSTILSLLRGLYLPQKANVICDGKSLKNGIQTLKQSITLIPQDPEIFNDTIRYNITMDMFSKSEELEKAIEMAQFKKVVNRLEKGVEASVQEKGVSLSGGEKQRLALARGILAARDSSIVLLDEPTSSVDSSNEKKIHENIFEEFKDKTIISSIHRLHLLDKFDYIYMFDKGKIIGQGTLEEIKTNPTFMKIWKRYIGSIKK